MECKYLNNQLYVRPSGQYRLCCLSLEPDNIENINTHTPYEWKESKTVVNAKELLKQNIWPDACSKCKLLEDQGLTSQRLKPRTFGPGISHLDLRFGNSCNLKCLSCWNGSSSAIAQEEIDMVNAGVSIPEIPLKQANINWISEGNLKKIEDLPIQEVYLTGGEPMMVKYLPQFLERLDPSTQLRFNTNCTLWNPKLEKLLRKFNTVVMSLSIDAVDHRNDYIRYGSNWNVVEKNAIRYADFCFVNISPVLSVLNAHCYSDIKEYADKKNWEIFENLLHKPDWLHCKNAPDELKKQFQIKSSWYDTPADPAQINFFKEQITRLDKWRKININDYLPNVAKAYGLN